MNRFSEAKKYGDAGGNGFKLPYRYRVKSLHSLWDKVMYAERKNIRRPITDDKWDEFQINVDRVMTDHAADFPDSSVYQNTDFYAWSLEAHDIA